MIVVADSGPLIFLAGLGRLECLKALHGQVLVPPEVWHEVTERRPEALGVDSVRTARGQGWISVVALTAPAELRQALRQDLDAGEAAALALAVERRAQLVLVDERKGRAAARKLGLAVRGTLATLVAAKRAGLLDSVGSDLARLRALGFWVSQQVVMDVLRLAGEAAP